MNSHTLIVCAMEVETAGLLGDVLYTGIGKVNAAICLERELHKRQRADSLPNMVINYGSAGSKVHSTGELVQCTRFMQRDMDVTALGFEIFATPLESDPPIVITPTCNFKPLNTSALCGSGDSFVANAAPACCDVLDMEAYALAKVCHQWDIAFTAFKYISDGADDGARADWEDNVSRGIVLFKEQVVRHLRHTD